MKKRIVSLVLTFSVLLSMLPMSVLTAFAQDSILYGDADGNEKVDMSDVNLMEQYIDGDAEAQTASTSPKLTSTWIVLSTAMTLRLSKSTSPATSS